MWPFQHAHFQYHMVSWVLLNQLSTLPGNLQLTFWRRGVVILELSCSSALRSNVPIVICAGHCPACFFTRRSCTLPVNVQVVFCERGNTLGAPLLVAPPSRRICKLCFDWWGGIHLELLSLLLRPPGECRNCNLRGLNGQVVRSRTGEYS